MPITLIRNLAQVATPAGSSANRSHAMRQLRVIDDAALVIEGGRFAFVGAEKDLSAALRARVTDEIDAGRGCAIPGFVDTHTHLPFAGYRESELNRRLHGETYQQIAASGGGIASTVRATRSASEAGLCERVLERTRWMALYGTTTAEAKSGYGLDLQNELKQLRAIREASERSPVRLLPTCLAAHEFPPGIDRTTSERRRYIDEIVESILPSVARERLALFCDVFVEDGVFTATEGEEILSAGKSRGLTPRVHADEFSDTSGAELASRIGAASADHLMHISSDGIAALAASDTVANLLPATSFFLMSERFAPARELVDRGAIVSLSTDCNPGSSMTESMQIVVQLASLKMKLTVEEALTAATLNGAYSIGLSGETGSIEVGKLADFQILEAPSYLHLVYHFGVNLVRDVFRSGNPIVRDRVLVV